MIKKLEDRYLGNPDITDNRKKINEIIDYLEAKKDKYHQWSNDGTGYSICKKCGKLPNSNNLTEECFTLEEASKGECKPGEKEPSLVVIKNDATYTLYSDGTYKKFPEENPPETKGGCICSFEHLNNGMVNANIRSDCPVHNPFKFSESKGECKHDWHPSGEYCLKCRATYKEFMKDKVYLVDERNFKFNPPEHEMKSPDFDLDKFKKLAEEAKKTFEHEKDFDRLAQGLRNHVIDDVRFSGLFEYVKDYIKANFVSKEKIKREIDKLQKSCYEADGVIDGITALHHLRDKLGLGD